MLTIIDDINEFGRENLLERQREGIAIAKKKGKFKERKVIEHPQNWSQILGMEEWRDNN